MTPQDNQPGEESGRKPQRGGPPVLIAASVGFLLVVAAAVIPSWLRTRGSSQAKATVTVLSEPASACAYLDGELLGPTPARREGVAFGEHELRIEKALFVPRQFAILVDKRQYAVAVTLDRTPASNLTVQSTPPGGKVFLDGSYRGSTPLALEALRPGSRHVRVQMDDRETWQGSVLLEPHKTTSVHAALRSLVEDRYQRQIHADPTNVRARVDLALEWLAQRRFEDASEILTKTWRLAQNRSWEDPAYVHLRTEVARAYHGKTTELNDDLAKMRTILSHVMHGALTDQPANADLLACACDLFAYDSEDLAGVEVFEALVKRSPGNSRVAMALSRLYVTKGSPEKAVPLLEALVQRQRTDWQLLRQLAEAYQAAGRGSEARSFLRGSLLHCDREAERKAIREDLAKMRR